MAELNTEDLKALVLQDYKRGNEFLPERLEAMIDSMVNKLDDPMGVVVLESSTIVPLAASATFTGTFYDVSKFNSIVVSALTDQDGIMYVDFSPDGTNVDSTLSYNVVAGLNETHRATVTRRYFRARFTNSSSLEQTYLRLQSLAGGQGLLAAPLNQQLQQDADSIVVKTFDMEALIAQGFINGYSIVNKFGNNLDVRTGSVPEDVTETGGIYTGWATAAETVAVLSNSANDSLAGTGARTVRLTGLDANYNIQSETVTLNGTTPVNTINTFIRVHTAQTLTAGSTGANEGVITFRQSTTTANVFLSMQIGRNQTNSSAYTVPAGYTGYMIKLHSACAQSSTVSMEGYIYTRAFGGVFRGRRPFYIGNNFRLDDTIYGGLVFSEKTDIIIRIISCSSASAVAVNAGYDLIIVKN